MRVRDRIPLRIPSALTVTPEFQPQPAVPDEGRTKLLSAFLSADRAQRRPDFLPVPSVPAPDLATTADRPARRALRPSAPGRNPRV